MFLGNSFCPNDYYPFGMVMPGRKFTSTTNYRYGFNGKEEDDEVKGDGNQQDYGMRIYDTRLGRFLSVDPLSKKFPYYTPYQYAGNKPIWCVDLDGLEDLPSTALNKYGEKQVYEITSTTEYGSAGTLSIDVRKKTPSHAQPVTKGMNDIQVYQLAFNRFAEPGKHLIKSNQYIDERLMKAEQQVEYFYSHNVPGWSKSESATRTIHAATTAALFSGNEAYAKASVEQIKIVDTWDYNINIASLAVSFAPIKVYQNINSGLARLSRVINRSASLSDKGFQSAWGTGDLGATMDNLLGKDFSKISFEATETGKVVWSNEQTGFKVIQDPLNKYFRVQNKDGHYVGTDGKQVVTPSNLKGKAAKDYQQQNTHFNY